MLLECVLDTTRPVICTHFQGLFAKTEDFIAQNLTCVTFYVRTKFSNLL
jgi:hypothetical protein